MGAQPSNAAPSFVPEGKSFGFNATLAPNGETHPSTRTLDAVRAAGATHLRMGSHWRAYEYVTSPSSPVPPSFSVPVGQPTGHYETDRLDAEYVAVTSRGIRPSIMVLGAPHWASHFHRCQEDVVYRLANNCPPDWRTNPYNMLFPAEDRMPQLRAFVAALARRYPLAQFEGTNEPDYQKSVYARYHPPISLIAEAQCQIAAAVKSVDPQRVVLGPGLIDYFYFRDFLAGINGRKTCFDAFNLHVYSILDVRSGYASSFREQIGRFVSDLKGWGLDGRMVITEIGNSDRVMIPDENFNGNAQMLGEPIVAKAFPTFYANLFNHPDIHGLFLHTVREGAFNGNSAQDGYGLLRSDYSIKAPGGGIVPRFCTLALSAGNTWPGCEAYTLPGPPAPAGPSFFQVPRLMWDRQSTVVGKMTSVLFLEQGHPAPDVSIVWYRCNSIGLGCLEVKRGSTGYMLTSADRLKTIKVGVGLVNDHGATYRETKLSPPVQG